jgi:hypothetical protein
MAHRRRVLCDVGRNKQGRHRATARELYKLKELHERTHHSKNGGAEHMNRTMKVIPRATITDSMFPEVLATKRVCILQTMTATIAKTT